MCYVVIQPIRCFLHALKIMKKKFLFILAFGIFVISSIKQDCYAKWSGASTNYLTCKTGKNVNFSLDTIPPVDIMDVIGKIIYATNNFNINEVANLYTPNAVVTDDEAPFSWNGPTAGVQWVNAVEKACKDIGLTKFKATIESIHIFQQTGDNVYIVVPVSYTGYLPQKERYTNKGAFTFVLRLQNNKWMVKSQTWTLRRAM